MVGLKEKALNFLKNGSYTVQELCDVLDMDGDLKVVSLLTELQIEKLIKRNGDTIICREDGGAIILGKYTAS